MSKIAIKTRREIELMRESCRIVRDVLQLLEGVIVPGISTGELDRIAEEFIRSQGGEPAFKGYGVDKKNLFPATLCVSVNNAVVHGIPNGRILQEGDIVSIDVGVKKGGWFGDGAWTFPVGRVSEKKQRLMSVTKAALSKGIEQARAGNRVLDISRAVQEFVEANGFSVVRDLVGHGVGKSLHEEPAVPNFVEPNGNGVQARLKPGMVLAIEPMVNAGTERVSVAPDGWTVLTADGEPSAHFEHTIVITENEPEILTK